MGEILHSYIMPHPPIIVPGIGGGTEKEAVVTIDGCRQVAKEILLDAPSVIILSSPHAPCFRDFFVLSGADSLKGDFGRFGHPEISMQFENHKELAAAIIEDARAAGIGAGFLDKQQKLRYGVQDDIDHGTMVPLFFVEKEMPLHHRPIRLVHLSTPFLPLDELYRFGKSIQKTVLHSHERAVYIASGDLSHRLTRDAPAGFHPYGQAYDKALVEMIGRGDAKGLLSIREMDMEEAGECGTRSFAMMFGFMDAFPLHTTVYSYEGPFGVGYLTAKIEAVL
jgi:aromatic ring-opening dioxygenase LigB subunit